MSEKGFSRRAVAIGGGIAVALGLGAIGVTIPRLLSRHYRSSPYDDLLTQLVDRDAAVRVGNAAMDSGTVRPAPQTLAKDLRQRFERRTLAEVSNSDLAQSRLSEVKGWVLPESLTLLCVLAAEES
jgi:hypothetical protein